MQTKITEIMLLKQELESSEHNIRKEFIELKKNENDAKFISIEFVKKGIFDMFGYVLEKPMKDYHLIDNELAKENFKSVANKTDLHFVNKNKTHHVNVEINQFKLQTTEQKKLELYI